MPNGLKTGCKKFGGPKSGRVLQKILEILSESE